ncbi:saccharopine dehydrogenase [Whalleya microplaca]|nr:saccharopine dehydrogenase [Whalleya microplaca]
MCRVSIVKAAIKSKKIVVTMSYMSPAMKTPSGEAKAVGITVMNVIRYKISWSSRGVLLALKNDAKDLENGKEIHVIGEDPMGIARPIHTDFLGYSCVAYQNQDITSYLEQQGCVIYDILCYAGRPASPSPSKFSLTHSLCAEEDDFLKELIFFGKPPRTSSALLSYFGGCWHVSAAGIFSGLKIMPKRNPSDTQCATYILEENMAYQAGKRDSIFLQHQFDIGNKDASKDITTSRLCEYGATIGSNGNTVMTKLVGILVSNETISDRGYSRASKSSIDKLLMQELKEEHGSVCLASLF